jgi:hypothetical protein
MMISCGSLHVVKTYPYRHILPEVSTRPIFLQPKLIDFGEDMCRDHDMAGFTKIGGRNVSRRFPNTPCVQEIGKDRAEDRST